VVRRTKADAESTRQHILDAAEAVFRESGVARTSLHDVAVAAGVTRGAIYWHFEDKAQLFEAMMDRVTLPCECAVNRVRGLPGQSLRDELQAMALAPIRLLQADERLQRVFHVAMHRTEYTGEMAAVRLRHLAAIDQFQAQLRSVLDAAQTLGQLRPHCQSASAAFGLFALVDGLMHHWTLAPERFDLLATSEPAVTAYVDGLFVPAAAAATTPVPVLTGAVPAAPAPAPRQSRARRSPST
jgi:TetR/AcrR family acrAB operon transcriptional repressor